MVFDKKDLHKLFKPHKDSSGEDNGQVTIIGGSSLFHGAPLLCLTTASRIVDMVFFASPEPSVGGFAAQIKPKLLSFIWVPWEDLDHYIEKSDAILIGPGMLRFSKEANREIGYDHAGEATKEITESLLSKFLKKKWVIDAGSLQTMDAKFIPENAILTPNKKEFEILFRFEYSIQNAKIAAKKYHCVIVVKGPVTNVFYGDEMVEIHGGNAGMTKGGTGDVQAGLTVALLAKNDPMLAATSAAYIVKAAADELYEKGIHPHHQSGVGVYYNADDLASKIPEVLNKLIK